MAQAFTHEFRSPNPPETAIANVAKMAPNFEGMGYRIESHTPVSVVIVRTTSTLWGLLPLAVGLLWLFARGGDPTSDAAQTGLVFWTCVGAAVAAFLFIKKRDRLTFVARADGEGSAITVTGQATEHMAAFVRSINSKPAEAPSDKEGVQREASSREASKR